jgi:predicted amidohydrolase
MLRIALASPPFTGSIARALPWVERFIGEAAAQDADLVCFPEAYIPGLRGPGLRVEDHDPAGLREARDRVCRLAEAHGLGVIMPMDWDSPAGILNVAFVISERGEVLGCQTKNQIAPDEDDFYVPGRTREIFELQGVRFGIAICHEGWRYPETVRWAAVRGAQVVFHPNMAGSDRQGRKLEAWGAPDSPHYEKAMVCRSLENAIYFASVNYALKYQEAATALVSPEGDCLSHLPYGVPGVLIADLDPKAATGLYASRFAADRY